MEKIKRIFSKTMIIAIIVLLFWIIENAFLNYDQIIYPYNPIFVLVGVVVYIGILIFTINKIIPKLSKFKLLPYIIIMIFFGIAIFIGYTLRLNPSWDMGETFNIAKNYAMTNELKGIEYLISYPNNIMITGIYMIIFKVVGIMGYSDYITIATIFNAIIITLSVALAYKSAKLIYGHEKALIGLLILLCTTPLYMHVAIYYTDSMSMFFSVLILYLILLTKKNIDNKKSYIFSCLLALSIFIGWKVKITSVFVAIAATVCTTCMGKLNLNILKRVIAGLVVVIIFGTMYTILLENKINNREESKYCKMPIEHWILLGLHGNGGFNQELYEYTSSFPTYEEKQEADREKIKQTVKSYTCNDFIKHITLKLKFAWTDGTYFAPEKLRRQPVEKNILHMIVLPDGEYCKYYKYLPQVMHVALLILMLLSATKEVRNKNASMDKLMLIVSVLGLMLFLVIWENRSRYILTMLPIYVILAVDGIEYLKKLKEESRKNEKNI